LVSLSLSLSLYFLSLGLGALGFLEDSLNVLGLGFYPKKTKELGFVRNPRGEEAYACWRKRRRGDILLGGLASVMLTCWSSLELVGFFLGFP
jgi:hypothetical protein